MYLRKIWSSLLALFCAGALICVPSRALADLYQIVDLGNQFDNTMFGLTSGGDVVVQYFFGNTVCAGGLPCYGVFSRDGSVNYFATAPALTYDNGGHPCNHSPTWIEDSAEMNCNNGRIAVTFAGIDQLWTGPDPVGGPAPQSDFTLLLNGNVSPVFLNSNGDVAFGGESGPNTFRNFVAYDLGPSPEPSSLILMATGALGLAPAVRRRLTRSQAK
jgi:hypothetical protein